MAANLNALISVDGKACSKQAQDRVLALSLLVLVGYNHARVNQLDSIKHDCFCYLGFAIRASGKECKDARVCVT